MTPEQEDEVRRALASVPAEQSTPPEVAARLDATLARLVGERAERAEPGTDELEQRRRRRWPRVLVAAASVTVLGYGAGAVLTGLEGSGGGASTAARDETFAGGAAEESAPDAPGLVPPAPGADVLGGSPESSPHAAKAGNGRMLTTRTVRLHADSLGTDVRRLLDHAALVDGRSPGSYDTTNERGAATLDTRCSPPATSRGDRRAPARLDGIPATLVVRRGTDGTRVAEVYACDDPERLLAVARLTDR